MGRHRDSRPFPTLVTRLPRQVAFICIRLSFHVVVYRQTDKQIAVKQTDRNQTDKQTAVKQRDGSQTDGSLQTNRRQSDKQTTVRHTAVRQTHSGQSSQTNRQQSDKHTAVSSQTNRQKSNRQTGKQTDNQTTTILVMINNNPHSTLQQIIDNGLDSLASNGQQFQCPYPPTPATNEVLFMLLICPYRPVFTYFAHRGSKNAQQ